MITVGYERITPEPHEERLAFLTGLATRSLVEFEAGRKPLDSLVDDVLSVIDSLEEIADSEWIEVLRSWWWRLELVNAACLDGQRVDLDQGETEVVAAAVQGLKDALAQRLRDR